MNVDRREQAYPTLGEVQMRRLRARGHERDVRAGELLFKQGDANVPTWIRDDSAPDQAGRYVDGQASGVNATANAANDWITQAAVKNGVVLPRDMEVARAKELRSIGAAAGVACAT